MKAHTMKLQPLPFAKIKAGLKTVELRLYDEKRREIAVGDTILFRCGEDSLRAVVRGLHRYSDFAALYADLSMDKLGYPPEAGDMTAYYSEAEQARYGVLGIEIEVM